MRVKPFLFLLALTAVGVIASTCHDEEDPFRIPSEPQWSLMKPTTVHDGLAWTSCFRENGTESHAGLDWECARLKVPMNHDDEASPLTENNTVILALVKRKANKNETYRGSILMNPGGPGSSAVEFNLWFSDMDFPGYDMITWDPRGMARSTPRQQCWSTPQRNALYIASQPGDASEYDDVAHLNALRRNWMTVSAACNDLSARTANNIHRYVSTYQHAHDMRSVMRAMGDEKVNFYGISWGTTLGMYFASLFPDLVGRMILEANVDIQTWTDREKAGIVDGVEDVLAWFFKTCASTTSCAIHESTPEAVEARYDKIMELTRVNSTAIAPTDGHVLLAPSTYTYLLNRVWRLGYRGNLAIGAVAADLALAEQLAPLAPEVPESEWYYSPEPWYHWGYNLRDTRPRDPMSPDDWVSSRIGPEDYTQCNDWGPWPDDSLEKLVVEFGEAKERHRLPGRDIEWPWSCVGKDVSEDRFPGPFGGKTAHPILFSTRRLDMATPWSAAKRNSEIFEGSRVLTIEGVGHSINKENKCLWGHYLGYLVNGTLPDANATCPDDTTPQW